EAPERGPSWLARLFDTHTAAVLSARYVELKLSDLGGSLVLLAQAPVIGLLIGTAFGGGREHARMDLILALVAVWFGCFNGCREVVKERAIFLRERRAGVSVRAYVLSKFGVLALLSALQCLILVAVVSLKVTFEGSVPGVFVSLFSTAVSASCLGLLLSSLSRTQNSLIAYVPLALIPQLIFNEVTLGGNASEGVQRIEWAMLGAWSFDALKTLRVQPDGWVMTLALDHLAILGMGLGFVLLAGALLHAQSEE
ncbi:MAG: ABC transporter permease, partial [Planctomycetes bacterium]|nr:ABC transporter permease [Planctomycetota bacterium]